MSDRMQRSNNKKWVIGGSIIAAAIVAASFLNLGGNLIYFYTPEEAFAKAEDIGDDTIRIGGMVKEGTVNWKPEMLALKFTMTDFRGHDIEVSHRGSPPDMFKENQGVVVEGRISDGGRIMTSRNLMVKHSEEYKPPGQHGHDKELLEKSIFGESTSEKSSEGSGGR